jgi:connector enhancer of kinase suppressor of Ras 2
MKKLQKTILFCIRSPFSGQLDYQDRKSELLKLSLAIATCAQRDRFAERPVEEIRTSCKELARLADSIIQDIVDPLILQPASLDLATLKKRAGDDLVSNECFSSFFMGRIVKYTI